MLDYQSPEYLTLQSKLHNVFTDDEVKYIMIEAQAAGWETLFREGCLILKSSFGFKEVEGQLIKPIK